MEVLVSAPHEFVDALDQSWSRAETVGTALVSE
jgi:hypothetical protein